MSTFTAPGFTVTEAVNAQRLYDAGDKVGALNALYTTVKMHPRVTAFKATIALILHELHRHADAIPYHLQAINAADARPEYYSNYANTLRSLGRVNDAHHWNWKALKKDKSNSLIWNNQGCVATELGDITEALACFDKAIALDEKNYMAYFNRGNAMLLSGDYSAEAWGYYDFRGLTTLAKIQPLPFPWWCGESLANKSLFLEIEQGAGDTFQFCRYLFALRDKYPSAKITFQVDDSLYNVMRDNFGNICNVVPGLYTIKEPYDYRALLMHLPRNFPDYDGFTPYLRPTTREVSRNGKFHIGLCWRGNPQHANDFNRSIHNTSFLFDLVKTPFCEFSSLQKGVSIPGCKLLPLGAWEATLQLVDALDLIITVDTSIAHVAGALGKNVWLLIPKAPDWRWDLTGTQTKWYPTMKIFRQSLRGDWRHVIDNVSTELLDLVTRGQLGED